MLEGTGVVVVVFAATGITGAGERVGRLKHTVPQSCTIRDQRNALSRIARMPIFIVSATGSSHESRQHLAPSQVSQPSHQSLSTCSSRIL
jgi:hypothetical protein